MKYEYKFERIPLNTTMMGRVPSRSYQEAVHQAAKEGWRLVQIFAPSIYSGFGASGGVPDFFELVLEREADTGHDR